MRPANGRWRYFVMSSLIGWAHLQGDPWTSDSQRVFTVFVGSCKRAIIILVTQWQKCCQNGNFSISMNTTQYNAICSRHNTNSHATSDKNCIKMRTFPYQWTPYHSEVPYVGGIIQGAILWPMMENFLLPEDSGDWLQMRRRMRRLEWMEKVYKTGNTGR